MNARLYTLSVFITMTPIICLLIHKKQFDQQSLRVFSIINILTRSMAVTDVMGEKPEYDPARQGHGRHEDAPIVSLGLRLLNFGPLLILILLIVIISIFTPNFLKPVNMGNIIAQTAVIAIVAIGQHLVILTRGIDLSVGANLALATVIGGLVFRHVDSAPLVILAMLA